MMLGLTKREVAARFDEIVAFAELEDFIDAPVKTYSSGMYMRLGFAVAIHVDPDVLLVDEVLAVGDEAFTHKCLDKFAEFKRRGRTVLLVTHSLDLVTRFCDEALWLDGGVARLQGDPKRVVDAYLLDVAGVENQTLDEEAAGRSLPAPPAGPDRGQLHMTFRRTCRKPSKDAGGPRSGNQRGGVCRPERAARACLSQR